MLIKKNPKKIHANLIKCQVENCPTLPGRNLITTCNRRVTSVSAGRIEISSLQARMKACAPNNLLCYYTGNDVSTRAEAVDRIYIFLSGFSFTNIHES